MDTDQSWADSPLHEIKSMYENHSTHMVSIALSVSFMELHMNRVIVTNSLEIKNNAEICCQFLVHPKRDIHSSVLH